MFVKQFEWFMKHVKTLSVFNVWYVKTCCFSDIVCFIIYIRAKYNSFCVVQIVGQTQQFEDSKLWEMYLGILTSMSWHFIYQLCNPIID